MKKLFLLLSVFLMTAVVCLSQQPIQNLIIVTTDGLRWQEVFKGMDTAIANNNKYNEGDSAYIYQHYWSSDAIERRKKLMPFLWSTIAVKGQLFGNREAGCKVNVANPYWFSYPGYNEIFTGYPDTAVNSNDFPPNPNVTVLEYINKQKAFSGKVAAFGAWDAFDRILNQQRSGIPVMSAFDATGGNKPTTVERAINAMNKDAYRPFGEEECLDVFTHYAAFEHLKSRKPRVLYIAYGETDEWAHSGKYRSYLDAAHLVDQWLSQLWGYLQKDPFYKGKTAMFITVDHGRGDVVKKEWTSHNNKIIGCDQIWFATLGPGIPSKGEIKKEIQLYQKQFAQTFAKLLGITYTALHPIAEPLLKEIK